MRSTKSRSTGCGGRRSRPSRSASVGVARTTHLRGRLRQHRQAVAGKLAGWALVTLVVCKWPSWTVALPAARQEERWPRSSPSAAGIGRAARPAVVAVAPGLGVDPRMAALVDGRRSSPVPRTRSLTSVRLRIRDDASNDRLLPLLAGCTAASRVAPSDANFHLTEKAGPPRHPRARGIQMVPIPPETLTQAISTFVRTHFRHFNAATVRRRRPDGLAALPRYRWRDCFLTLAGAMSTAELGLSLAEMIRQEKVHAICCTGANLEETSSTRRARPLQARPALPRPHAG